MDLTFFGPLTRVLKYIMMISNLCFRKIEIYPFAGLARYQYYAQIYK